MTQHTQVLVCVPALEREKTIIGFTTVSLRTCETDELSPLEMLVALRDTIQVNSTLQNKFIR